MSNLNGSLTVVAEAYSLYLTVEGKLFANLRQASEGETGKRDKVKEREEKKMVVREREKETMERS